MKIKERSFEIVRTSESPRRAAQPEFFQARGREAGAIAATPPSEAASRELLRRYKRAHSAIVRAFKQTGDKDRLVIDHFRTVLTAEKETCDLHRSLLDFSTVTAEPGNPLPRSYVLAQEYLRAAEDEFDEDSLAAFIEGAQHSAELAMGEVWAIKPALQLVLLEDLASALERGDHRIETLFTSLRCIGETVWEPWFERVNFVDRILSVDPIYPRMERESRDQYRRAVAELAEHSGRSERDVARVAIGFSQLIPEGGDAWQARQSHVGFWLIDAGRAPLENALHYKPPTMERLRRFVLRHGTLYYLVGIELLTLLIAASLLEAFHMAVPAIGAIILLLIPATQAAVEIMNNLTSSLLRPRVLPKLDFENGIPPECATIVAVPTLLINEQQVRALVADLEIRYLGNRESNLYFALVSDTQDSPAPVTHNHRLADLAAREIEALNHRHGNGRLPFFLFHRHPIYNSSEDRWMGWERKRGKLLDLNQLMRGGFDAFPLKVGDTSVLRKVRYVITLDSDTQLPRDTARRLIGAMAHPLNRPVIDPVSKMVVAGYGILQPRIGVSIHSASRSRLASIYSGQTGFDIYTQAVSDVYQDLFGEGTFTGKGIYDVDAFNESLEHRFPTNALLSHDLIEGAYARAGLATDIELIDDYPSHFRAYSRRNHRWMRGDWQILRWLWARVPDAQRHLIPNPISVISRWKIVDNLRRSLFMPATITLLLAGWFALSEGPLYWTLASLALLLLPVWSGFVFALLRFPRSSRAIFPWIKDRIVALVREHFVVLIQIIFLLHQALVSIDAIVRSVLRVFITGKKLLEWETAAEAESATLRRATVDRYLTWSPWIAMAIAAALAFVRRDAFIVAAPILFLWCIARLFSDWLNSAPRTHERTLRPDDVRLLRGAAVRTWRYFREWGGAESAWLIPDYVRASGEAAQVLSPTNLGMLLNARIAAVHLGYLTVPEFITQTLGTLNSIARLPKHKGHLLNWYSNSSGEPLPPHFVSTVDSGNLLAAFYTLEQACLAFRESPPDDERLLLGLRDIAAEAGLGHAAGASDPEDLLSGVEPENEEQAWWLSELRIRISQWERWRANGLTEDMRRSLDDIARHCRAMIREMDFSFLYDKRKKVLSIGYDTTEQRLNTASYDLLASEARTACFLAIAKGDIPQEAWFHLGRKHTLLRGERVLLSWTGTMFEYLMPSLWMQTFNDTIMADSMHAVVEIQRKTATKGIPWGASESAFWTEGDAGYAAIGVPELSMNPDPERRHVIAPYATFLALPFDQKCAVQNLRRMKQLGWLGRYGFYEAVDFDSGSPRVVEQWMAHHQGMSLLAACNILRDYPIRRYFHSAPDVLATELLLQERVPTLVTIEAEQLPPRAA